MKVRKSYVEWIAEGAGEEGSQVLGDFLHLLVMNDKRVDDVGRGRCQGDGC